MQQTTRTLIGTILKTDPTITTDERGRILDAITDKPAPPAPPKLLRRSAVAERLGLSIRAVDRLAEEGTLMKRVLPGRKRATGFIEADVNRLIQIGGAA